MADVSLIIPCHQRVEMLRLCMESLRRGDTAGVNTEIIVLFNGTDAAAREELTAADLEGVVVVASDVNLGFAAGCNMAAREARGEFLIFLNDDVEVERGWLAALMATAAEEPDAGAIGSRVVLPSGELQEAGSIIWSDGRTYGVGRGLDADGGAYAYRRKVDYCSACALLVRAAAWRAVDGFDESFLLGYYEDADLCLRIKELGMTVIYEPLAVVNHHEHASSGQELRGLLFEENYRRFCEKWAGRLGDQVSWEGSEAVSVQQAVTRARGCPVSVLIVDDRLPDPALGSGASRMFLAVRELSASGYAVALAVLDRDKGDPRQLGRLGVEIVCEDIDEHLARAEILYDVVIMSRPNNYQRVIDAVRRDQPQAVLVYDAEALYHRRLERQAELETSPTRAAAAREAAEAARETEAGIGRAVDLVVCISDEEAEWVRQSGARSGVEVVPPFDPTIEFGTRGFAEREGILFVAGWLAGADSPNGDGLLWFVQDILPLIEAHIPWVQLYITGAKPPQSLRWLESPTVKFLGHVGDLGAVHDRVRVVVAPLRYGAGVKLKTLDAIARGVPVVGTTVGLEGVPGLGGEAADVADDPTEFARATVALLSDRSLWERRRARLQEVRLGWAAARQRWPEILDDARRRALAARADEVMSI